MVDKVKDKIEEIKNALLELQLQFESSHLNDKQAKEYLNYLKEKSEQMLNYFAHINSENAIHIYYAAGALSRYFGEFDWHETPSTYKEAKKILEGINISAQEIMNHYN
jgi:hypothetical protein